MVDLGSLWPSAVAAWLLSLGLAGCTAESTRWVVDLRTDLRPVAEFDSIETEVFALSDEAYATPIMPPVVTLARNVEDGVAGVRLAEFEGLPPGDWRMRVRMMRGFEEVGSKRVLVTLRDVQAVTVVITRDCEGVTCPDAGDDVGATECLAGRCASEECSPETPDLCPPAECRADSDCTPDLECVPEPGATECTQRVCVTGFCLERWACGDGERQPLSGEFCDDGNRDSGDGCNGECRPEDVRFGAPVTSEVLQDSRTDTVPTEGLCDEFSLATGIRADRWNSYVITSLQLRCQAYDESLTPLDSPYTAQNLADVSANDPADCPDGSVITGITVEHDRDRFRRVRGHCAPLARIFERTTPLRSTDDTIRIGWSTGATFSTFLTCPPGAAVIGLRGSKADDGTFASVHLVCSELSHGEGG